MSKIISINENKKPVRPLCDDPKVRAIDVDVINPEMGKTANCVFCGKPLIFLRHIGYKGKARMHHSLFKHP